MPVHFILKVSSLISWLLQYTIMQLRNAHFLTAELSNEDVEIVDQTIICLISPPS